MSSRELQESSLNQPHTYDVIETQVFPYKIRKQPQTLFHAAPPMAEKRGKYSQLYRAKIFISTERVSKSRNKLNKLQ
jgi:hypothetical protein